MHSAPQYGPAPVGHAPFLPDIDARSGAAVRSARLDALLKKRDALIDEAGSSVQSDLMAIADEIGARVVSDLEARGLGSLRVAVDTVQLDDLLGILADMGVDQTQAAWFDNLRRLAGMAEDAAAAAGIAREDASLDQEGLATALQARYQDAASWWDATIERPLAQALLDGLHDARALTSPAEIAARLSERMRISVPKAYTEALTQTAVVDRFISAEIAQSADPEGTDLRWAYLGPVDGIEREFCQPLSGRFFKFSLLGALDNGTALPHPIYSCGGYRCRHRWAQAPAALWRARGLSEGSEADILAANAGAR